MKPVQTLVILQDQFCVNKKNQEFPPISHKKRVENCCEGGLDIANNPSQRKEEYDLRLVSYKINGNHI